jgi:glutamine amidotransferase
MRIAIVDYGMGNIHSLKGALTFISSSADIALVNDEKTLGDADLIFLPGVGHFKNAMEALDSLGLSEVLQSLVLDKKSPIMGICLGMQLLFSNSTEGGINPGLGLIEGKVRRIKDGDEKIPHIGFDEVNPPSGSKMFAGVEKLDFYFVHSFCVRETLDDSQITYCNHNDQFFAAIEKGHIWGTQFHPEKSQENGLKLLRNFIVTYGN